MIDTILQVALAAPLYTTFDYLLPGHLKRPPKGGRVLADFGGRLRVGVVIATTHHSRIEKPRLKSIHRVLDEQPVLDESLLELLIWAGHYYHHPIGEVIAGALPQRLRQGHTTVPRPPQHWTITALGREASPNTLRRAPRQAELLAALEETPQGLTASQLNERYPHWRASMARLAKRGLAALTPTIDAGSPPAAQVSIPLNQAQMRAAQAVCARLNGYHAFVLDGVTGSGKTEVYRAIAREAIKQQRQVLILVPEIALTAQLIERFRSSFGRGVAVMHSALTDQQRHLAWHQAGSGEATVIIGTRSAIFTPLIAPGVIIVDEEHDNSFKQQEGFRYHGRDVAVYRARQLGIPVVLGSATPCLESLYNIEQGKYTALHLPERAGSARQPAYETIDLRGKPLTHGLSRPLLDGIDQHLRAGNQVLLFMNRRGFAPTLLCYSCGWAAHCDHCDAHLTYHAGSGHLRCHHCGAERELVRQCSDCGSETMRPVGAGTERIEQALAERFPATTRVRIDRDTIRGKGSLQDKLAGIRSGAYQLLIGTQMLSKGHDFPRVTLACILNVDHSIYSTDFRALEHMAQLIVQVAGRAGRADKPGTVILQTHQPDHPLLRMLIVASYSAFAKTALEKRAMAGLPPYRNLALLRAEARPQALPMTFLDRARAALPANPSAVEVLGPVPSPMERRAGRYRAQLLLSSTSRRALHVLLGGWIPQIEALPQVRRVRWSIDVDPVDLS